MASKRIQDILDVCAIMKDGILTDIDNNYEVSIDEVEKRLRDACHKVAEKSGRTYSTPYDACTRRMNYSAKDFYDSVKEIIQQKGQSLVNRMYTQMVDGEDTEREIRDKMSKIFGLQFELV